MLFEWMIGVVVYLKNTVMVVSWRKKFKNEVGINIQSNEYKENTT